MNPEHIQTDGRFFSRWVLGTFAGWVLGFVLLILGIFAGELTGLQLENFAIGIGMGAGVGYTQGRIARPWLGAIWPWVSASVIGMGLPLLAFDIYFAVWGETSLALPLMIAPGGLLVGLLQRRILRLHYRRANWWVPACTVGWALGSWTSTVTFTGAGDAILNLIMILSGGVLLGAVTSGVLVWMDRDSD